MSGGEGDLKPPNSKFLLGTTGEDPSIAKCKIQETSPFLQKSCEERGREQEPLKSAANDNSRQCLNKVRGGSHNGLIIKASKAPKTHGHLLPIYQAFLFHRGVLACWWSTVRLYCLKFTLVLCVKDWLVPVFFPYMQTTGKTNQLCSNKSLHFSYATSIITYHSKMEKDCTFINRHVL